MKFSEVQIHRYSRQMILPGVGGRGQRKLTEAKVFIMGAGGLGSPAALYLAAAGVGTLGLADSDLVLDGSDNFPTRFLVNDACYFERKTLISGAILRFEGQLSTFKPHANGPCYRCLLPEPPLPGHVPSCQEAGVLGAVAGIIGLFQANEALKEILGIGQSMTGRFLFFNALDLSFTEMKVPRK